MRYANAEHGTYSTIIVRNKQKSCFALARVPMHKNFMIPIFSMNTLLVAKI